jgi:antitoxin MazE
VIGRAECYAGLMLQGGFDGYVREDYLVRTMKKKLTRSGNSVALVIDRPVLDQLGLSEGAEVEVSTNGDVLVVTPLRNARRARKVSDALDSIDEKYAGVFRRLAK